MVDSIAIGRIIQGSHRGFSNSRSSKAQQNLTESSDSFSIFDGNGCMGTGGVDGAVPDRRMETLLAEWPAENPLMHLASGGQTDYNAL